MARAGFIRRHKVAVASNTALVLAAGAVIGYAVAADGYQAHEAQLNDGGIWVVHGDRGIYGRINKPINQLDTIVFGDDGSDRDLDVVQDGAAVAAIDRKAGTAQIIDPFTSKLGRHAARSPSPPTATSRWRAGRSPRSTPRRATCGPSQLDPQRGKPLITSIDVQSEPLDLRRRGRGAGGDPGGHRDRHVRRRGHDHLRRARRGRLRQATQGGPARPRRATRPPSPRSARRSSPSTMPPASWPCIGGGSATVPAEQRPAAARSGRRLRARGHARQPPERRPRVRRHQRRGRRG